MPNEPRIKRIFRFPWRSAERIADEIDSEVEFHLAMRERELRESGLSAVQARAAAHEKFGDVADMKQYCRTLDTRTERARRTRERLASIGHDVRYALRQLRKAPAFTVTAIVTLALGIGANVAIMSVAFRMLVAPLPFPGGERLVSVVRSIGDGEMMVSPTAEIVEAVRGRGNSFEWVGAFQQEEIAVGRTTEAELMMGVRIEPVLMTELGLPPALGRPFLPDEAVPNGPPVAMLSYGLWKSRFGGARDILGSMMAIDGVPHTIVGVTARDFDVLNFGTWAGGEVWRPYTVDPDDAGLTMMAMLRAGVTMEQANRELTTIGGTFDSGTDTRFALKVMPAKSETTGNTRRALFVLMGAVSVVLLIACANVAGLLLVRAAARDREIAVRIALGAGRGRLVRQMLTESLLIALLGGAAALVVAHYGLQALVAARPESLSDLANVRLNPAVLGWCVLVSLVSGIAFGLAPTLIGSHRVDAALKGTRAASGTIRSRRARAVLVAGEVALSVSLLVAAGLLVRSVQSMHAQDLGFDPAGIVTMRIVLPEERYASREARAGAYRRILDELARVPGLEARTYATGVPPTAGVTFGAIQIEGRVSGDEPPGLVGINLVRSDYFRMLGMAVREGTVFGADTAGVVIISETMARKLWQGESAIGRRFRVGDRGDFLTVVGVVADTRAPGHRTAAHELQMYRPFSGSWTQARLILRPAGGDEHLLGRVMQVAAEIDPTIMIRDASTIESELSKGIAAERFNMRLLSGFAIMALVLSAIGLYGVIAYGVAQRTRELGMRIALGALQRDVLGMVVRQGMRLSVIGIVIGFAGAAAATRAMQSMLFEVSPLDPVTFAGVGLLIMGVSLLASWLPARRAAKVDPITALRAE